MSEPDELYTLRAQFWLGHYALAVEEAKSVSRRPMSVSLKAEREEFLARALTALGECDKVVANQETPALKALALRAQWEETAATNEASQDVIINQLKTIVGNASTATPAAQLAAAQTFLLAGLTKEALQQCLVPNPSMEQMALALQIYLRMDRLDLASSQLQLLRQSDEESIVTQLSGVFVHLAAGSTGAADALHTVTALSEQYGPSAFLLNLMAAALMQQGEYAQAEAKLLDCLRDFPGQASAASDTLINLIACSVHLHKPAAPYVQQFKQQFPSHSYCAGLERVMGAFEREAIKYKV